MDDIMSNIQETVKRDFSKPPKAPAASEPSREKRGHDDVEVVKVVNKKSKRASRAEDRAKSKKPVELEDIGTNVVIDEDVQEERARDFEVALTKVVDVFHTVDQDCKDTLSLYYSACKKHEAKSKKSEGLMKTLNEVTIEANKLREEVVALKNEIAKSQGEVADIRKFASELEVKLKTMEENHDREIAIMRNAFINDACKNFLQCKVTMMEQVQDGSYVKWNLEEARETLAKYQKKTIEEGEMNSGAYASLVQDIARDIGANAETTKEGAKEGEAIDAEKDGVRAESGEGSSTT